MSVCLNDYFATRAHDSIDRVLVNQTLALQHWVGLNALRPLPNLLCKYGWVFGLNLHFGPLVLAPRTVRLPNPDGQPEIAAQQIEDETFFRGLQGRKKLLYRTNFFAIDTENNIPRPEAV
jgi:hypothetical protein